MGTRMASAIAILTIGLLIIAAAFEFTKKRKVSGWLLVPLPAFLCAGALLDLSRGAEKIGAGAFESDLKQLVYLVFLLLLCLLVALRPRWRWLFWTAWTFSALVCGILVYLAFFWKVFS
jgi:cell division protein FtsW (lipid II flippase)